VPYLLAGINGCYSDTYASALTSVGGKTVGFTGLRCSSNLQFSAFHIIHMPFPSADDTMRYAILAMF